MPLYISLAPDNKHDLVFEQTFMPGKVHITLRPLSLPGDWPYISKWLQRAIGRRVTPGTHLPDKYLRETYAIMLECDFAQPFVGVINGQPVFLVEICDGDKQCDGLEGGAHLLKPGDHVMRLMLSQTVIHTRYWPEHALFITLAYFFSHQQVKRIVWQLHEKDKFYISLANQSGIREYKPKGKDSAQDAQDRRAGIQVYLYLRENYMRFLALYHRTKQKLP